MGFVDKDALALAKQTEAVTNVLTLLRANHIEDDESVDLSISSETTFDELVERFLIEDGELEAEEAKLDLLIKRYKARRDAASKRRDFIRTILHVALQQAGLPNRRTAYGTITDKALPDALVVDEQKECEIPTRFWKEGNPVLRKAELRVYVTDRLAAIAAAMKLPEDERAAALAAINEEFPPIDGVELETGRRTLNIRK